MKNSKYSTLCKKIPLDPRTHNLATVLAGGTGRVSYVLLAGLLALERLPLRTFRKFTVLAAEKLMADTYNFDHHRKLDLRN